MTKTTASRLLNEAMLENAQLKSSHADEVQGLGASVITAKVQARTAGERLRLALMDADAQEAKAVKAQNKLMEHKVRAMASAAGLLALGTVTALAADAGAMPWSLPVLTLALVIPVLWVGGVADGAV